MVAVFCRVSVDISPDFIDNFPSEFDFEGMLKRICDDVGVVISTIGNSFNLEGQWNTVGKAHNMLVSTLAVYGSSNIVRQEQEGVLSQGSRPFSALVEAAEAISRGVELQEQVQKEMMGIDHVTDHGYTDLHTQNVSLTCMPNVSVVQSKERYDKSHTNDVKPPEICHTSDADTYDSIFYNDEQGIRSYVNDAFCAKPVDVKEQDIQLSQNTLQNPMNGNNTDNATKVDYTDIANQYPETKNGAENAVTSKTKLHVCQQKSTNTPLQTDYGQEDMPESSKGGKKENHKTFPCDECEYEGKTRNAIADHRRRVHKAELTKCDICKKIFPNSRYMKRHRLSHGDPKYACDICGKQYKVLKAMKEHKKRHDKTFVKPEFKCEQCPKSFCSSYVLECHVKSEHMGIKKSFLCQTCGKSFTTKHTLQQHVNVHIGVRPYQCKDCGKSFCYESALRDHLNIHEGTKKFQCDFPNCNKAFRQRSALKMHEKIHKEKKDFMCHECDRGFTQKQALQRHIRSHKGVKPFTCKFCHRKFGEASVIRRHLILVHKVVKLPSEWREDIISFVNEKETDSLMKKNDQVRDRLSMGEMIPAVNHDTIHTYATEVENGQSNIRLPPVTAIHNFRPVESFMHELNNPNPDDGVQEQSANITGQMSYTLPPHHDYAHTTTVSSAQYNYIISPVEFAMDNGVKAGSQTVMEAHKSDPRKAVQYGNPNSLGLDAEPPENFQNSKPDTVQYLQQTADDSYTVIDVGKMRHGLENITKGSDVVETAPTGTPSVSLEQLRPAGSLDPSVVVAKETTDGKASQNAESLECVNMSQLYTYYSNLASQYMNVGPYMLPNTDTTEHSEL